MYLRAYLIVLQKATCVSKQQAVCRDYDVSAWRSALQEKPHEHESTQARAVAILASYSRSHDVIMAVVWKKQ